MKPLETDWKMPPTLMLRMMAISPQTEATGIYRTPHDCYEIKSDGIAKMFTSRLVVREGFKVLSTEWWSNLREKRIADVAMQRLAIILHNNKVPFYKADFHASDWKYELQLNVSSPKNPAIYCVYVYQDEWGRGSWQNQVRCGIQISAKGLDKKIVRRVKMIDDALYVLLNDCMEWAKAQPEV